MQTTPHRTPHIIRRRMDDQSSRARVASAMATTRRMGNRCNLNAQLVRAAQRKTSAYINYNMIICLNGMWWRWLGYARRVSIK